MGKLERCVKLGIREEGYWKGERRREGFMVQEQRRVREYRKEGKEKGVY